MSPAPEAVAAAGAEAFRRKVLKLKRVPMPDRERRLLAELVGQLSIVDDGDRVFVDVEMEAPARLLVAGASPYLLAGEGFAPEG